MTRTICTECEAAIGAGRIAIRFVIGDWANVSMSIESADVNIHSHLRDHKECQRE
jgi:hypothetical protein